MKHIHPPLNMTRQGSLICLHCYLQPFILTRRTVQMFTLHHVSYQGFPDCSIALKNPPAKHHQSSAIQYNSSLHSWSRLFFKRMISAPRYSPKCFSPTATLVAKGSQPTWFLGGHPGQAAGRAVPGCSGLFENWGSGNLRVMWGLLNWRVWSPNHQMLWAKFGSWGKLLWSFRNRTCSAKDLGVLGHRVAVVDLLVLPKGPVSGASLRWGSRCWGSR